MKVVRVKDTKVSAVKGELDGILDRSEVMKQISIAMWTKANEAFDDQGRNGDKWPGRMTPNIAAIVNRLNNEKNPRPQDFRPKIALRDTGHLQNSLTPRHGKTYAEVGTVNADYATKQQEGGPSEIILTKQGRKRLAEWLRKNRTHREQLGWLFGKPRFVINVIPRKFLMVTEEDLKEYTEIIESHVEKSS